MSNCEAWQKNKVSLRFRRVEQALKIVKRYKSKIVKPTELCILIAKRISAIELSEWERSGLNGKPPKPLTSATLLRRDGSYRVLIDSYLLDVLGIDGLAQLTRDPAVSRILEMNDLAVSRKEARIVEMQNIIESLQGTLSKKSSGISSLVQDESSTYDSMAHCTNLIFELLLSTGCVNFDEARGEILQVSRARKVILDSRQLGVFLNWRSNNI